MHTNVILTNKRRTHAQSNYTNTKLKAWFRRLLRHPARKRSGPILHPRAHTEAGVGLGRNSVTSCADNDEMFYSNVLNIKRDNTDISINRNVHLSCSKCFFSFFFILLVQGEWSSMEGR